MDNEELLDLLDEVMREHHPEWVLSSKPEDLTVICFCMARVRYHEHLREMLRERVAKAKAEADAKTTEENK